MMELPAAVRHSDALPQGYGEIFAKENILYFELQRRLLIARVRAIDEERRRTIEMIRMLEKAYDWKPFDR